MEDNPPYSSHLTKIVEDNTFTDMNGRPAKHLGLMVAMLTQNPAGSGIYGNALSIDNLQNFASSNILEAGPGSSTVALDGSSGNLKITSFLTPTGITSGLISVAVQMHELGHNSFLDWGYWLQENLMQAGGTNYYFENSYYVKGDNTEFTQMQNLQSQNITGKYSGNAYATYWNAPGGPSNRVNMSGSFSADVNFASGVLSNINIAVSGHGHSASISGATASFALGPSTFQNSNNIDGQWKIDGVDLDPEIAGTTPKRIIRGAFYGPNAVAIGGLFEMNSRLTNKNKYVNGVFQGTR